MVEGETGQRKREEVISLLGWDGRLETGDDGLGLAGWLAT
jgi:hypothetical protein